MGLLIDYFIFLITIISLYGLGTGISLLSPLKSTRFFYNQVFFNLLTGLIAFVVIYSLIKTSFITINLVILILAIGFWINLWYRKKKYGNQPDETSAKVKFNRKHLVILLIGSLVIFGYAAFILPYHKINGDYIVYARSAYYMQLTGDENEFNVLNLLDKAYNGPAPFHFFELWFTAGVAEIFGKLSLNAFLLFFPVVFLYITLIGILAIFEYFSPVNYLKGIGAVLLLSLGGLLLPFYEQFPFLAEAEYFGYSILPANIKYCTYYPFILGVILSLLQKELLIAVLVLSCLAIGSVVLLPSILVALALFLVIQYFLNTYKKIDVLKSLGFTVASLILFFLFYAIFGNDKLHRGSVAPDNILSIVGELTNFTYLKTRINIIGSSVIRLFVLYIPCWILLFYFYWKNKTTYLFQNLIMPIILLIFLITSMGLLGWATLYQDLGAVQVFFSTIFFINGLFIILLIAFIDHWENRRFSITQFIPATIMVLVILTGIFQIITSYEHFENAKLGVEYRSDKYYDQIKEVVMNNEVSFLGASLKGEQDYNEHPFAFINYVYVLGDYLSEFSNEYATVSISDYETTVVFSDSLDNARKDQYIALGTFYRYVQNLKRSGTFISIEQSQVDFIEAHGIGYIIATQNGKISDLIKPMIKRVITNERTGERFIILKSD